MLTRHPLLLLATLAAAPTASAEITNIFATSFLAAESRIEIEGDVDLGPLIEAPFTLTDLGSINESRQSLASVTNGDASATSSATGSFSSTSDTISLNMDSAATATLDARSNDTFSFVKARSATIVGFTTDEHVRVTLTGDASIFFNLNTFGSPLEIQSLIDVIEIGGLDNPVFEAPELNDDFTFTFILDPGEYQLRMAADATFQTFGFPQNLYTVDSHLNVMALIEPVPAPATALLFPLAAAFSTRRRRVLA